VAKIVCRKKGKWCHALRVSVISYLDKIVKLLLPYSAFHVK